LNFRVVRWRVASGATLLMALTAACTFADNRLWIAPDAKVPTTLDAVRLNALLAANRLKTGENIKALPLYRDAYNAAFLVQVREREPHHYHADSNITVFVLEGRGVLHVGKQVFDMVAGDSALVPRGTPHYFVNHDAAPAAALVIYAPPPGKDDRVLLK